MEFVIIDLEFNNLRNITKYFPNIYNEHSDLLNSELDNEIIEIGAVKLDRFLKKTGEFKRYIKPTLLDILNPSIRDMTGITELMLDKGMTYIDAMDELKEFIGESNIVCSWAKDDITEIIKNSNYHNYKDIGWIKEYIDIQEYATNILGHKKSLSLKHAIIELGLKANQNRLHDALYDAIYTAKVFKRLYNYNTVKNFIVKNIYEMPAVRVKNLKEYRIDVKKLDCTCPKCRTNLIMEHPFKVFSWRLMSIGICPKCKCKTLDELIVRRTLLGDDVYSEIKTVLSEMEYINYSYKFQKAN